MPLTPRDVNALLHAVISGIADRFELDWDAACRAAIQGIDDDGEFAEHVRLVDANRCDCCLPLLRLDYTEEKSPCASP